MHSNFLQLGRLHIPVFGVFAAIGLMASLALSQWTAPYARLAPQAVWNAGMTAVVGAFVISRALLVAFNWHSFVQYPLLVLALPSFTSLGVLLTGLFMLAYLQWRGLPMLRFLDAMAPCAALLWAFLSAGRFVEGTRDGMPTRLPWGVSDGSMVKVHPVELYAAATAVLTCLLLLRVLRQRAKAGKTVGVGLLVAGVALYVIDFFRLPSDLLSNAWLDPAQAAATATVAIGCVLVVGRETKIQTAAGSEGHNAV